MEFIIAIIGTAIGLAGLVLAWLGYRHQMKSTNRHLELQLWKKGDAVYEGYLKLRNDSQESATVDLIKVIRPRASKIAWFIKKAQAYPPGTAALDDADVTDTHIVKLIVEPGKTAGVAMAIGWPASSAAADRITLKCRLHPADKILGIVPRSWRKVSLPLRLAL